MNLARMMQTAFFMMRGAGHKLVRRYHYTEPQLRAIRKKHGVGRPPHVNRARLAQGKRL